MIKINEEPGNNTDFQLLAVIIPDIDERLKNMKKIKPELFEEIRRRARDTKDGWRPLHYWRGAL